MVWYSQLFKNFLQFVVIHIDKSFGVVNKAEVDVFLELSSFLMIQQMLAIWYLVPLPFLNQVWTSGSSRFMYCWSLAWRIFEHYFPSMWDECICAVVWTFFGTVFLWENRGIVDLKRNWEGTVRDIGWKQKVMSWKTRHKTVSDLRQHS